MAILSKIKKPCLNAVARESERASPRLRDMLAVVAFNLVWNKMNDAYRDIGVLRELER